MKLSIKVAWIETLVKKGFNREELAEQTKWRSSEQYVDIVAERFTEKELDALYAVAKDAKDDKDPSQPAEGSVYLCRKIAMFRKLKADPAGVPIGTLQQLETALRQYIGASEHKWLFTEEDDNVPVPYYVHKIDYQEANLRDDSPAHTTISMAACRRSSRVVETVTFHTDDLQKKTVVELLQKRGFYLENPEVVADYMATVAVYKKLSPMTGEQFLARGTGLQQERRYYGNTVMAMERDGVPTRVVMDDRTEEDDERGHRDVAAISAVYWSDNATKRKFRGEDKEDVVVLVPVQPYVKVFDLQKHLFVDIHVGYLEPYVYDATLIDKLVLPQTKKDLVGILIQGSSEVLDDIVKGKTGGIIVIATGPAGTGKTLTAEVFSEEVKRPLYAVQCSQLGTSEEALETKLQTILARATRWKAILLIDEADVYVHERGSDIQQNAIVGVFLRVLEYYRGIMFMTSNRSTIIDDAIMSRATAWIKYDYPSPSEAKAIWRVLAANYKLPLNAQQVDWLVTEFDSVSGRSIKNLLKLARLLSAKQKKEIDMELFRYVAKFLDLEYAKKRKATDATPAA